MQTYRRDPLWEMSLRSATPWLNTVQYPFRTRQFDSGEGTISYTDEGRGRPIVMVHGVPTWSYLYRHLIRGLAPWFRCIAPDHLGFGLSDKPLGVDYRPQAQATRFARLMDHLEVDDCALMVHESGGPIALEWALRHPGRVRELILFNTWMWNLNDNRYAMRLARLVGNPFNRFYYRALNASPSFIMPAFFADRHRIPKATQLQYLEPFRPYRERQGLYRMIEGYERSGAWFQTLWDQVATLEFKRTLLLWGTKDPIHGVPALRRWQSALYNATTVEFPEVGRFVPEEASRTATEEIRWFLINAPRF